MLLARAIVEQRLVLRGFAQRRPGISCGPAPSASSPAISSVPSARRASPREKRSDSSIASAPSENSFAPRPRSRSSSARRDQIGQASSLSGFRTITRARDKNGEITSNDGFSVVAPISVKSPLSTCGRKASCCARFHRWISSINNTVRLAASPARGARLSDRIAQIGDSRADRRAGDVKLRARLPARAGSRAWSCPLPGGPHRIIECSFAAPRPSAQQLAGPSRCSCPITSSSCAGRIRSAKRLREWRPRPEQLRAPRWFPARHAIDASTARAELRSDKGRSGA